MFTNKTYILISFLLCLNVFSYGQSVTKNDSLILILKQLEGVEEKLRLGVLEKHKVADSIYFLWKSEMELKLSRLVLLKEEYEK